MKPDSIQADAAPQPTHAHPAASSRSITIQVAGLHLIGLVLLALHIWVRFLPPTEEAIPPPESAEAAWWGLWPVTHVPGGWFWLGVSAIPAMMAWAWWTLRHASSPAAAKQGERGVVRFWPLGTALLLCAAFFLFPIAHTRWGDAYLLNRSLAWPDPALRLTHSWQAPLDVWLHSQVWRLLQSYAPGALDIGFLHRGDWNFEQEAVLVYRLLSPIAGMLYLGVVLALCRDRRLAPPWLTFSLLASLGLIQLFFGYIENYSFAAAGILAFLWQGRRVLRGEAPLWSAALILALTNATHPSTIVYAPALLYVGWVRYQANRTQVPAQGTRSPLHVVFSTVGPLAWPMLLVGGATVLLMETGGHGIQALLTVDRPGGSDASWFVPLTETQTRWEAYTLLSWPHVRDLINQMLLVAPVVLPSLLWLGLTGRLNRSEGKRGQTQDASAQTNEQPALHRTTTDFFAIAALAHLGLIVVWNPDYGGQRDWDLFSLAWIPTTAWLIVLASRVMPDSPDRQGLRSGFAPLILLQALHTAAWIYQNTLPWQWP